MKKLISAIKMTLFTDFKNYMMWIIIGVEIILSFISLYTSYNVLNNSTTNINGVSANSLMTAIDVKSANELMYWCRDIISGDFLIVFTIIFSSLVLIKDYSSGFLKTILNNRNRQYYYVSKIFILMIFIILMITTTFFVTIICNFIFLKTTEIGDFLPYLKMLIIQFILNMTVGLFTEMIAILIKKHIFSLISPLIYYLFFSEQIYNLINKVINNTNFDISKYTIFGTPAYLVGDISVSVFNREIVVLMVYFIIIFMLSSMSIKKIDIL